MSDPYSALASQPEIVVRPTAKPEIDPYAEVAAASEAAPDPYAEVATAPAAASASKPWAVSRGFVSGLLEQNPEMGAEALEGFSHLAPESLSGPLGSGSQALKEFAGRSPEEYKRTTNSMWDVKGIDDALAWAGETFGSGVASSVPSVVAGGLGALAGSPGGPVGATVGAVGGALVPSYVLNYGEVYKALKDEKMDPKLAAKYAAAATVPISALDVGSLASIAGRFGGVGEAKKAVVRSMAQRIAAHAAGGGTTEGVTEALQGAIKDLTVVGTTAKTFDPYDFTKQRIEDFVGGAIVGGPMSAPAGLRRPTAPAPTPNFETLAAPPENWTSLLGNLERELGPGASKTPPTTTISPIEELLRPQTAPPLTMTEEFDPRPLPDVGPVPPVVDKPIEAYHGSPYEFGEFDAAHIGSGEGTQSFGYGLYFAEEPLVAQDYSERVGRDQAAPQAPAGNVYKVRIRANRDQFLDWDLPLSQQSLFVQDALARAGVAIDEQTGGSLYDRLAMKEPGLQKMETSRILHSLGIAGIRYLDAGSRPPPQGRIQKAANGYNVLNEFNDVVAGPYPTLEAAQGRSQNPTRNFVVFNPKSIGITHRNGQELVRSNISPLTPRAEVASVALRQAVMASIRRVAGAEVAGRTELLEQAEPARAGMGGAAAGWNRPRGQPIEILGLYYPARETHISWPLVQVSLSRGLDSMQVAMHEGWHAIEGTLTKDEVAILKAATPQLRAWISRMKPGEALAYQSAEMEEVWAEASSMYAFQKLLAEANPALFQNTRFNFETSKLHPMVRAILDKITQLIAYIRKDAETLGFYKVRDVFESFYQGEMASRRQGLPATMLERWWAQEEGYSQALIDRADELATQTDRNNSIARRMEGDQLGESNQAQLDMLDVKAGMERVYSATGGGPTTPVPTSLRMAGVHADRLSRYKKWWMFLDRLVDKFPDFPPLVRYYELAEARRRDIAKVHDVGIMIAKRWRSLGKQAEGLAALIDDVAFMKYRTPDEVRRGIVRHPTSTELAALAAKHKVTPAALQVYELQKKFFVDMLLTSAKLASADAHRLIKDPNALADRLVALNDQVAAQMKRPYFPFMRFGRFHVVVKDAKGNTVERVAFERRGLMSAERRQQQYLRQVRGALPAGFTAEPVTMSENSVPYAGMPPALMESIATDLNLDKKQRDALEQLRYEMAPSHSFQHQFQHKNYTPGYSHDFLRAFSRYAFHGARYLANAKYSWQMREQVVAAKAYMGNLASELGHFMEDHLANTVLSTKSDYGKIRGAMFVWALGYVPAAAVVNLSQNTLTHAMLASRFGGIGRGDLRAAKAMSKAMLNVRNFYHKAAYEKMSGFEYAAIDYGIKSGRISETMGAELAGIAQGEPLLGMGSRRGVRAVQVFIEKSAFLFEMAEQLNRRVTFRATLELAMKYPNSKGVKEAMNLHQQEYQDLITNKGFTAQEAQAIVSAVYVTNETQFIYSKDTRPKIMRGRSSIFFVFQSYMMHLLQLLGNNKTSVMPRFVLFMWLLAGLQGLPGADEAEAIFNQLASWKYGKDFKLRHQLRAWLKDLFGSEDYADLVLHGLSSRGFGLPALMDMMGEHPGRGLSLKPGQNVPMPNIDMSRSLGSGHILPIQLDKLLDPGKDANKAIAEQTQRASGAIVSIPFNWYKAIFDIHTPASDPKRWENSAPRVMANLSKSYRAYTEGFERGLGGPNSAPKLLPFDKRDPEQMAEIIGMAMGFQSARKTTFWERETAKMDAEAHIKVSKEILMIQYFEAMKGGDAKELEGMNKKVNEFNENLPDYAKGEALTGKSIRESMMTRDRGKEMKEIGVATSKKARGISEYFNKLFPDIVDMKKVK